MDHSELMADRHRRTLALASMKLKTRDANLMNPAGDNTTKRIRRIELSGARRITTQRSKVAPWPWRHP